MQANQFTEIAWEDRTNSVKIMLFLNDIGQHDKSKITTEYKKNEIDIIVNDFKGNTYRFHREPFAEIIPEKCKYTLSSNRINLFIYKAKEEKWTAYQKGKEFKAPKMNSKDPQAGLMDMMKQMYQDGDDEMKRTIAKAWTEAQDKKMDDAK